MDRQKNTDKFYRTNPDGDAEIFGESGEIVTRIDASVYPVGSSLSARYEQPQGITLTIEDAEKLGIVQEDKMTTKIEEDKMVINSAGKELDYDAAVALMDDDLREELHNAIAPCTDQEFLTAYEGKHSEKFGECWEL